MSYLNVKEICAQGTCPKAKTIYKLNTNKTAKPLKFKLTALM